MKKTKKKHDGKFSLSELVWLGFNYTCGISFTAAFSDLVLAGPDNDPTYNLGANIIWIFVIEGLIAFMCAWAYNRLSRIHTTGNGGTYLFARANYGRGASWILSFIQYSSMPVIVTSQIVSMIRINFVNDGIINANWGGIGPTTLYFDLIGLLIFIITTSVLFFGIKWFKFLTNISGYIKWGLTVFLLIVVIVAFAWNQIDGADAFANHVKDSSLSAAKFSHAFMTLFFFFLGFETFVTVGANVRNPEKNIGRSVIIVMSMAIVFYIITTILFLGAIVGGYSTNPNMQVFKVFNNDIFKWFGAVLMIICAVALKGNSLMQNALYSGGILEPQAKEGFIPEKFAMLNKENIPFKASFLNYFVNIFFVIIFTVLPDLIYINSPQLLNAKDPDIFNYAAINSETSLVMIIVYGTIVSIAIKTAFQGKMRANWFEKISWCLVLIFLIWQLYEFFDVSIYQEYKKGKVVTPSIDLGYILIVFAFAILQYYLYYIPKFKKRLQENPEIQSKLDAEFKILPDKSFIVDVNKLNAKNEKFNDAIIKLNNIKNSPQIGNNGFVVDSAILKMQKKIDNNNKKISILEAKMKE